MIRTTKDDSTGVLIVEPGTERLTAANATQFKEEVVACIDAGENMLVIDLSQTGFVDSSGIGALVGVLKRLGNRGEVVVCGLGSDVRRMFEITRMNRVFTAHTDRAAAVSALAATL